MSVAEISRVWGWACCSSAGSFVVLSTLRQGRAHKLTTLYGAALFTIVYWYAGPIEWRAISRRRAPDAVQWAMRASALTLAAVWLVRTYRKEGLFVREAQEAPSKISVVAARSLAARRAMGAGEPEVSFEPEGKRVAVQDGRPR